MFNQIYKIKYNDSDKNFVLKPQSLFEFMEDVASENADNMGIGYKDIYSKNYGWFVLKYAIEFFEYPKNLKNIQVGTQSRGANKLFAYRDFEFSKDNKIIGRATSTWALMDLTNKSILNPLETLKDNIQPFEKKENDIQYNKIPQITNPNSEIILPVKYYDIDVNGHVNNAVYLSWVLNNLPVEFLENKIIKRIDVVYKKDIGLGNNILLQSLNTENKTIHSIKNNATQEDLCNIQIEWH